MSNEFEKASHDITDFNKPFRNPCNVVHENSYGTGGELTDGRLDGRTDRDKTVYPHFFEAAASLMIVSTLRHYNTNMI